MSQVIRHITSGLGVIPTDLETQACSGLVGSALGTAEAQTQRGHRAQVFGWNPDATSSRWNLDHVEVHATPGWRWAHVPGFDFRIVAPMLALAARAGKADVIHAYTAPQLLLWARGALGLLHLQTPAPERPGRSYTALLGKSSGVICCSDFIRRQFLERVPYPAEQTFVVHNGIDPERFRGADGLAVRQAWGIDRSLPVILFAGALVPEKGLLHLLRAAARLQERFRFQLVVAGSAALWSTPGTQGNQQDDPYTRAVRDAAAGLPVRWLGAVPVTHMPAVFAAANIFVCPSAWDDPFPLVACEAMAAGKPIVASRMGGLPEAVVEGETGLLVPAADDEALAAALEILLANPEIAIAMGERARQRSELFSWAAAAAKLDNVYAELRANVVQPRSMAPGIEPVTRGGKSNS
jgi:glycosyltransferase involved in cell wall biosynthesis